MTSFGGLDVAKTVADSQLAPWFLPRTRAGLRPIVCGNCLWMTSLNKPPSCCRRPHDHQYHENPRADRTDIKNPPDERTGQP